MTHFTSDIETERCSDLDRLEDLLSSILPAVEDTPEAKLTIRLPVSLKESLRVDAEARGLNLSDYVRIKLLGNVLPLRRRSRQQMSVIERSVVLELNRIGTNLNQTVRRLSSQKDSKVNVADRQILAQLLATLQRIDLALMTDPDDLESAG